MKFVQQMSKFEFISELVENKINSGWYLFRALDFGT